MGVVRVEAKLCVESVVGLAPDVEGRCGAAQAAAYSHEDAPALPCFGCGFPVGSIAFRARGDAEGVPRSLLYREWLRRRWHGRMRGRLRRVARTGCAFCERMGCCALSPAADRRVQNIGG